MKTIMGGQTDILNLNTKGKRGFDGIIKIRTKLRIFNSIVKAVLLYRAET